ncbi:DUF1127 domain-containing protein [Dongia sp.]|uniref:DUF1127 domain-containing protein n=1 Tax=Dongia sp. TaxID=1977262 RepID=UPI0035AF97CD
MSRYKLPALADLPHFGRSSHGGATSLPRRLLAFLFDCLEIRRQRRALEALDERMLKDIGISRCDVEAEISRPFWR